MTNSTQGNSPNAHKTRAPTNNEVEVPRKCYNICGLLKKPFENVFKLPCSNTILRGTEAIVLNRFLCFAVWRHKLCQGIYSLWGLTLDRALIGFSTNWVVPLPEWQCINVARCTLMRRLTVNEMQTLGEMWTWWDQHPRQPLIWICAGSTWKRPHSESSITFESLLPLPPNHINLSSQTNVA